MLSIIAPMLRYNMLDDGFGNLVIVSGDSWASAYYHVFGLYNSDYYSKGE